MIKINEEYFILTRPTNKLRHNCQNIQPEWVDNEWKGAVCGSHCIYCKKEVDKKVLFIYKLWRWHNV